MQIMWRCVCSEHNRSNLAFRHENVKEKCADATAVTAITSSNKQQKFSYSKHIFVYAKSLPIHFLFIIRHNQYVIVFFSRTYFVVAVGVGVAIFFRYFRIFHPNRPCCWLDARHTRIFKHTYLNLLIKLKRNKHRNQELYYILLGACAHTLFSY